ncbi:MAG TPA: hypothetical protein VFS95_08395, partial [Telluria sp.]|nr:hypothetical protein [Telluria sp.]
ERYLIEPARPIAAEDLGRRLAPLRDRFEEAPNVADLQMLLAKLSPSDAVTAGDMAAYMGGSGPT